MQFFSRSEVPTVLSTEQEVSNLLKRGKQYYRPLGISAVSLELTTIPDDIRQVFEYRLNESLSSCGCKEGDVTGFTGVAIYSIVLLIFVGMPTTWSWLHIIGLIPIFIIFAILGTGLTLLRTRFAFIDELIPLVDIINHRKEHPELIPDCEETVKINLFPDQSNNND